MLASQLRLGTRVVDGAHGHGASCGSAGGWAWRARTHEGHLAVRRMSEDKKESTIYTHYGTIPSSERRDHKAAQGRVHSHCPCMREAPLCFRKPHSVRLVLGSLLRPAPCRVLSGC